MDICVNKECDRHNTKLDGNCEIHNGTKMCRFFKPLKAQAEPVAEVPCSVGLEGLLELAENWEQSAKDREASYKKDGNHFYKGASGVYASCAEALRLLIAGADNN